MPLDAPAQPSMRTPLTIAQLTDVHLGPIVGLHPRFWNLKRATGYANWLKNRRHAYSRELLARLLTDLVDQRTDHIAVTGDLTNLGLPQEIAAATEWLRTVGPPDRVSVIPGNHDIYSRRGSDAAVAAWIDYMRSSDRAPEAEATFPYCRILGDVALIGLNSAIATPPLVAHGEIGAAQRAALARRLDETGRSSLFRLVMIHHPPLPGQAVRLRGLIDASALSEVLKRHGAELVIHGHNHREMQASLETSHGRAEVIGAPSSSLAVAAGHEPLARYNLYRITRASDGWTITVTTRGVERPNGPVGQLHQRVLYLPRSNLTEAVAKA